MQGVVIGEGELGGGAPEGRGVGGLRQPGQWAAFGRSHPLAVRRMLPHLIQHPGPRAGGAVPPAWQGT